MHDFYLFIIYAMIYFSVTDFYVLCIQFQK